MRASKLLNFITLGAVLSAAVCCLFDFFNICNWQNCGSAQKRKKIVQVGNNNDKVMLKFKVFCLSHY